MTQMAHDARHARSSSTASCCARGGGARERLGASDFLLERVAEDIAERLAAVLRRFDVAVDLGTPGEAVRRALAASGKVGTVVAANAHCCAAERRWRSSPTRRRCRSATARSISWCRRWRCSSSTTCPARWCRSAARCKPDGLFLAALLGGDTLTELRQAFAAAEAEIEGGISPRVAPFADLRELGALLQRAGFALPVTDVDRAHACATRRRSP